MPVVITGAGGDPGIERRRHPRGHFDTMQSFRTRRDKARFLNHVIDRALLHTTTQHRVALLSLVEKQDIQRLAERIRRRATWLDRHESKQTPEILSQRDDLIMALYADQTPEGWANAWCDGSSKKQVSGLHAGIGTVLLDSSGKYISRTSRYTGAKTAFEAELSALVAVLDCAAAHRIERLRVHTDSKALVQLWYEHREDPRLAPIRSLSSRFKRLDIRAIPRLHNQVANSLAKRPIFDKLNRQHPGSL